MSTVALAPREVYHFISSVEGYEESSSLIKPSVWTWTIKTKGDSTIAFKKADSHSDGVNSFALFHDTFIPLLVSSVLSFQGCLAVRVMMRHLSYLAVVATSQSPEFWVRVFKEIYLYGNSNSCNLGSIFSFPSSPGLRQKSTRSSFQAFQG